jgi:ubiquinone/menaquinone biosynthesis C-methylase UbiE
MRNDKFDNLKIKMSVKNEYDTQNYSSQWETKAGKYYKQEKIKYYLRYFKNEDTILDVGCADLNYTLDFADNGFKVTGMDLSDSQIHAGKFKAEEKGKDIPLVVGDAEHLPFKDESFDTCISMSTLIFVPDPQKAIKELDRVSKKNIIIDVPNKISPYYSVIDKILRSGMFGFEVQGKQFHENEIKKMFEDTDFEVVKIEYILLVYRSFPDWMFYILSAIEKIMAKLPYINKLLGIMVVYACKDMNRKEPI